MTIKRYAKRVAKRVYRAGKKRYGGRRGLYKLAKDVYRVKSLMNVEFKKIDVNHTAAVPSTTWSTVLLNGIAQGDDYDMRNGRSVKCTSINVNGFLLKHNSAAQTIIRIALVYMPRTDLVNPTTSQIFAVDNSTVSKYNINYAGYAKVLYDRTIMLDGANKTMSKLSIRRKLYGHMRFIGTDATVGSIERGGLFLLYMSNEGTNTPTFNYQSRFRYVDN